MDEHGDISRCRTSYVTDDQIRELAARFPAPVQIPLIRPEPADPAGSGDGPRPASAGSTEPEGRMS